MTRDEFDHKINEIRSMLLNVAKSKMHNMDDAEDAVQTCIINAYKHINDLRVNTFSNYMYTAIKNTINDIFRKRLVEDRNKYLIYKNAMDDIIPYNDINERIYEERLFHEIMDEIMIDDEEEYIILTRYFYMGMSQKEIYDKFNINHSKLYKIKKRLIDKLKETYGDRIECQ